MKNMTTKQIVKAGKEYDKINNEGGEGYNPYWTEMERREIETTSKPITKKDRIKALNKKIRTECGSVAREWGNDEEIDKKHATYYAEITKIEKEIEEEFASEWTLEVTKNRREAWNSFVKAEIAGGKMTLKKYQKMYEWTKDNGYGLDDIKKAVALHNIN